MKKILFLVLSIFSLSKADPRLIRLLEQVALDPKVEQEKRIEIAKYVRKYVRENPTILTALAQSEDAAFGNLLKNIYQDDDEIINEILRREKVVQEMLENTQKEIENLLPSYDEAIEELEKKEREAALEKLDIETEALLQTLVTKPSSRDSVHTEGSQEYAESSDGESQATTALADAPEVIPVPESGAKIKGRTPKMAPREKKAAISKEFKEALKLFNLTNENPTKKEIAEAVKTKKSQIRSITGKKKTELNEQIAAAEHTLRLKNKERR